MSTRKAGPRSRSTKVTLTTLNAVSTPFQRHFNAVSVKPAPTDLTGAPIPCTQGMNVDHEMHLELGIGAHQASSHPDESALVAVTPPSEEPGDFSVQGMSIYSNYVHIW